MKIVPYHQPIVATKHAVVATLKNMKNRLWWGGGHQRKQRGATQTKPVERGVKEAQKKINEKNNKIKKYLAGPLQPRLLGFLRWENVRDLTGLVNLEHPHHLPPPSFFMPT